MGIGNIARGPLAEPGAQGADQGGKGGNPENEKQDAGNLEKNMGQGNPLGFPVSGRSGPMIRLQAKRR